MPLPAGVAVKAGMILLQPGSGTAYAIRFKVVSASFAALPPATSLAPPPLQAAKTVAVAAMAAAVRQRRAWKFMSWAFLVEFFRGLARHNDNGGDSARKRADRHHDRERAGGVSDNRRRPQTPPGRC